MTDEIVELSFSIPPSKIEEIKKYAEIRGVPVADYILAAINQSLNFDIEHYNSDNYKEQKLRNEEKISAFLEEANKNGVSTAITEDNE